MRICIVTEGFYSRDGVGRSILAKVRMLESLGHDVTVLSPEPRFLTMPGQDARVRFLSLRDTLVQALDGRTDDFLSHDLYIYEYPVYYELLESHRLLAHKRVLFDYYGLTPPEFFLRPEHRAYIENARTHLTICEEGHLVLVHSEASRAELQRFARVPDEKIRKVPLALDPAHVRPIPASRRDRARRDLDLDGRLVLLYVGRLAGNKGLSTLVDALTAVGREYPQAVLLMAGADRASGYDVFREETLARARDLGVTGRLRITGSLSEDELLDAYAACDVVVSASFHEGFGLPVAEALALGRPVVVADATALPETAGPGALLFAPGDASALARHVVTLARDGTLREAQVARGLEHARRCFPEEVARGLATVLDELMKMPPRPHLDRSRLLSIAAALHITYEDTCDWPFVGPLVSLVRHRITLHLEKFFVRPLQQNIRIVARLLVDELSALRARIDRLAGDVTTLWARLDRLEAEHDRRADRRRTIRKGATVPPPAAGRPMRSGSAALERERRPGEDRQDG